MESRRDYRVKFSYTQEELEKLLDGARREHRKGCGRYSAYSFASKSTTARSP